MLVFTHVPKTAGSSINEGLSLIVGGMENMSIKTTDADDFSAFRPAPLIGGHIRFPDAFERVGEAVYVAALRDPIERILSSFFFALRRGGVYPPSMKDGVRTGFLRYYESAIRKGGRINIQASFFSRDRTAEAAIETIAAHYAVVWDIRRTDEVWPVIGALARRSDEAAPVALSRQELEAVPPMPRRAHEAPVSSDAEALLQGARPGNYLDWLGEEQAEAIRAENAEDVRLHAWLMERGGAVINPARVVMPQG